MTPMFVETLNSQAQESGASPTGPMGGKLRATQTSLEFSQTQTTGVCLHSTYPRLKKPGWFFQNNVHLSQDFESCSTQTSRRALQDRETPPAVMSHLTKVFTLQGIGQHITG